MVNSRRADAISATGWGLLAASCILCGIYFGSRGLRDFDAALVSYAGASVFSAFGLGYRYSMWLKRPPTRRFWRRGWQLFLDPRRLPRNVLRVGRAIWDNLLAQKFIEKRSPARWLAHACIFWGCILGAMVTFPLSFGWVRFETPADSQTIYRAFVFGIHAFDFPLASPLAPLVFNILDIAAVLVIAGVLLAFFRRARDRGALALQRFANDFLPLILLFAVSFTGLLLTASAHFMRGYHYEFLSQFHAVTVIFTLAYLPFGKFFHLFQRPAQLSIELYRDAGRVAGGARCARCEQPFASTMHVADLKQIERELGVRYARAGGAHWQDVCPPCRRKSIALSQGALFSTAGTRGRTRID